MAWNKGHTRLSAAEAKAWARQVKARDKYKCVKCGYQGSPNTGTVEADHIQPVAEGGAEHSLTNGQTLCVPCHQPKSAAEAARGRARNGRTLPPETHPGDDAPTESTAPTKTVQPIYKYVPVWERPGRFTTDPARAAYGPTRKPKPKA